MVLDLLELSRLDAGAGEMRMEEVDITDAVKRIASRYGFTDLPIRSNSFELVVSTDPQRLERIVSNLLINARDHAGGPTSIEILKHSDLYEIRIADSGPGVATGERERIFERFARGSASRNRIGTGLGLALVAEHSRFLGGRAFVESGESGGATFIVQLPVDLQVRT